MREDNYISKANKLLLPIYIVCTIFIAIAVMVNNIIRGAILGVALAIIDLFILYVVKKSNKVYLSAYIIPFAALLGAFGYALSSGGGSYLLFEFSMVSMFCMLYANRKAYIVLAIIEDVLFAFTQFILGVSLLGDQLNASVLAMHCFILILVQVLGERIITWIRASETIIMESEQNAVKTIEIVKDTGEELAVEVKYLKESTNETSKKSQKVLEAIDSIQNGANQQVATMVTMNQSINGVAEKVQDTVIFCERLSQKGKGLSAATKANLSEVQNVEKNIEDIQANMNKAKSTVDEFAENMREVMNVLSGIKEISNQINLLSLNASIEAARSGEAGRGFAVVAEQIRILSEQTKDTTNQIELVVKKAQDKVGDITEVVDSGDVIALEGQKSISTLYEKYNQMITDFVDMEENIQKEYSQIEEVFALVKEVEDNVENVTAISEEYVTASEHVLDLQRGQQEEIKKVEEVYLRINEQSNTLLEVANS